MTMIHLTEDNIGPYLHDTGILAADEEVVQISIPGEGNMNYTRRVATSHRSLIVKQSRAYVEKYPQIAAPADRVLTEAIYYDTIHSDNRLAARSPTVYYRDVGNNIILMEDLGATEDYSRLYQRGEDITAEDLSALIDYLGALHSHSPERGALPITNRAMRQLNHEHMYVYPFTDDNGLDLDSVQVGLANLCKPYQADVTLREAAAHLGLRYLSDGAVLLHGDYYPGSWLTGSQGLKIIDPEFCFYGFAEFDLGVCMAHLLLAQQDTAAIAGAILQYQKYARIEVALLYQCIGIEILRRIMGLAQLPLQLSLVDKERLLTLAYSYVIRSSKGDQYA